MKKILVVAVVFFIASAGYWWWSNQNDSDGSPGIPEEQNEQVSEQAEENAAGGTQLATPEVESQLVGEWRSTGDVQFTRTFAADGMVIDTYTGSDATTEDVGSWEVVSDLRNEPVEIPSVEGTNYLKLMFGTEALYFSIAELSADTLVMIYLNRGGALEFERIR